MSRLDPECYGDEYASISRSGGPSLKSFSRAELIAELESRRPCKKKHCAGIHDPNACPNCIHQRIGIGRDLFEEVK